MSIFLVDECENRWRMPTFPLVSMYGAPCMDTLLWAYSNESATDLVSEVNIYVRTHSWYICHEAFNFMMPLPAVWVERVG